MEKDTKKDEDIKEIEELKKQIEETKAKCEEYLTGWKRERADFINYKKDEMEKIGQLIKYGNEELILKILLILDNFYLAEKHIPEGKEFTEGFLQIKKQLLDFLQKEGIEPIETIGKPFDPSTMEAIAEASGDRISQFLGDTISQQSGYVIEELRRGYTLAGKIIRPAKVKTSK